MLTRRLRTERAGFTLPELLVVLIIFGVVSAIVMSAVITAFRTTRKGQARVEAISDLQKGTQRISRELRAADPLLIDNQLNFNGCIGARIVRDGRLEVHVYRITESDQPGPDGGPEYRLLEDYQQFADTTPAVGEAPVTQQLGVFIDHVTDQTLFEYLDGNGILITGVNPDTYVTASQVRITLTRNLPEQEPVEVTTVVNIRNARFGNGSLLEETCNPPPPPA